MNGDEDLGEDIIMKGEPYHYNQKMTNSRAQVKGDGEEDPTLADKKEAVDEEKMKEAEEKAKKVEVQAKKIGPTEKVSILEPVIASEHTTFYNKQQPKKVDLIQLNIQDEAEKKEAPKPV